MIFPGSYGQGKSKRGLSAALLPNPAIFQLYSYGQVFVQFSVRAKHALLSTGGVEYVKKT